MRYPFPWRLWLELSADVPLGRERSVSRDAGRMWDSAIGRAEIKGLEHVPVTGPVVVAANHYQRRGLWIAWPSALISQAVAQARHREDIHWLVTGALRFMQWRNAGPEVPLSAWFFRRVADMYEMIALPLRSEYGRMRSLRRWFWLCRQGEVGAFFPEGPAGRAAFPIRPAAPGVERVLRLLARWEIPVLPVGINERGGRLLVTFGEPMLAPTVEEMMSAISRLAARDPASTQG